MHATTGANSESPEPVTAPRRRGHALRYRVSFADSDLAVISLMGELDPAGAADLSDALDACAAVEIRRIEVDAEHVTFADSHGVHLLARHAADFRRRGGWLRLVRPSKPMRRVMEFAAVHPAVQPPPGAGSPAVAECALPHL